VLWDELSTVDPDDFDVLTVPRYLKERGDLHAGLDSEAFGIETLLEWYAADPRGEMPYPPDYPKMPGEPLRVQPSRKRH
jgi:hypothetical protein